MPEWSSAPQAETTSPLIIETDDGVTGLGDATLNGRELAVASYLRDHVCPLLIGRDARRITDTWSYLYKGAYWRGRVTMTAIAAVDVALWDLKGKTAGMPVYELLGGAARDGVMVYCHASGSTLDDLSQDFQDHLDQGFLAIRAQAAIPGLEKTYGIAPLTRSTTSQRQPAAGGHLGDQRLPRLRPTYDRPSPRSVRLPGASAARRPPPTDPDRGRAARGRTRAIPDVLDRGPDAGRRPGRIPADPAAHHHPDRGR